MWAVIADNQTVAVVETKEAAEALAQTERLFCKHVAVHYMG